MASIGGIQPHHVVPTATATTPGIHLPADLVEITGNDQQVMLSHIDTLIEPMPSVSVSTESSAAHERAMRSGLTEQTSRDEADAINKRNARSALSKLPKTTTQLNSAEELSSLNRIMDTLFLGTTSTQEASRNRPTIVGAKHVDEAILLNLTWEDGATSTATLVEPKTGLTQEKFKQQLASIGSEYLLSRIKTQAKRAVKQSGFRASEPMILNQQKRIIKTLFNDLKSAMVSEKNDRQTDAIRQLQQSDSTDTGAADASPPALSTQTFIDLFNKIAKLTGLQTDNAIKKAHSFRVDFNVGDAKNNVAICRSRGQIYRPGVRHENRHKFRVACDANGTIKVGRKNGRACFMGKLINHQSSYHLLAKDIKLIKAGVNAVRLVDVVTGFRQQISASGVLNQATLSSIAQTLGVSSTVVEALARVEDVFCQSTHFVPIPDQLRLNPSPSAGSKTAQLNNDIRSLNDILKMLPKKVRKKIFPKLNWSTRQALKGGFIGWACKKLRYSAIHADLEKAKAAWNNFQTSLSIEFQKDHQSNSTVISTQKAVRKAVKTTARTVARVAERYFSLESMLQRLSSQRRFKAQVAQLQDAFPTVASDASGALSEKLTILKELKTSLGTKKISPEETTALFEHLDAFLDEAADGLSAMHHTTTKMARLDFLKVTNGNTDRTHECLDQFRGVLLQFTDLSGFVEELKQALDPTRVQTSRINSPELLRQIEENKALTQRYEALLAPIEHQLQDAQHHTQHFKPLMDDLMSQHLAFSKHLQQQVFSGDLSSINPTETGHQMAMLFQRVIATDQFIESQNIAYGRPASQLNLPLDPTALLEQVQTQLQLSTPSTTRSDALFNAIKPAFIDALTKLEPLNKTAQVLSNIFSTAANSKNETRIKRFHELQQALHHFIRHPNSAGLTALKSLYESSKSWKAGLKSHQLVKKETMAQYVAESAGSTTQLRHNFDQFMTEQFEQIETLLGATPGTQAFAAVTDPTPTPRPNPAPTAIAKATTQPNLQESIEEPATMDDQAPQAPIDFSNMTTVDLWDADKIPQLQAQTNNRPEPPPFHAMMSDYLATNVDSELESEATVSFLDTEAVESTSNDQQVSQKKALIHQVCQQLERQATHSFNRIHNASSAEELASLKSRLQQLESKALRAFSEIPGVDQTNITDFKALVQATFSKLYAPLDHLFRDLNSKQHLMAFAMDYFSRFKDAGEQNLKFPTLLIKQIIQQHTQHGVITNQSAFIADVRDSINGWLKNGFCKYLIAETPALTFHQRQQILNDSAPLLADRLGNQLMTEVLQHIPLHLQKEALSTPSDMQVTLQTAFNTLVQNLTIDQLNQHRKQNGQSKVSTKLTIDSNGQAHRSNAEQLDFTASFNQHKAAILAMAETRFRELLQQTIPINTNHDQTVASSDVHEALTAAAQPFDDATNDIRDLFQTAITESDDINFIKTRIQSFEGRCLQPSDVEALVQAVDNRATPTQLMQQFDQGLRHQLLHLKIGGRLPSTTIQTLASQLTISRDPAALLTGLSPSLDDQLRQCAQQQQFDRLTKAASNAFLAKPNWATSGLNQQVSLSRVLSENIKGLKKEHAALVSDQKKLNRGVISNPILQDNVQSIGQAGAETQLAQDIHDSATDLQFCQDLQAQISRPDAPLSAGFKTILHGLGLQVSYTEQTSSSGKTIQMLNATDLNILTAEINDGVGFYDDFTETIADRHGIDELDPEYILYGDAGQIDRQAILNGMGISHEYLPKDEVQFLQKVHQAYMMDPQKIQTTCQQFISELTETNQHRIEVLIRALQDVSSNKPEKLNDYLTAITRDLCGNETSQAYPKFESQLPMFRRQLLLLMQIV